MRKIALILFLIISITLSGQATSSDNTTLFVHHNLLGSYTSLTGHPRIFMTVDALRALAVRIAVKDSYSSQRFQQLATQVTRDLDSDEIWDGTYAGCHITTYLYAFSYEPQTDSESERVHTDLHLGSNLKAPRGAAVVAARLALYASLLKAGAPAIVGAPTAAAASALARRILLAWGKHGFHDPHEPFPDSAARFCNNDGKVDAETMTGVGLQISRGAVYSAHAQDLLMYLSSLTKSDIIILNEFHSSLYRLIQNSSNYRFSGHIDLECNYFNNHVGSQISSLLALARLLDNKAMFESILFGSSGAYKMDIPWFNYIDKALYGLGQAPHKCYPNTGNNGSTSRPFFQTETVVAGEIDDRYRNQNDLQGIGYPMGTLEWLYNTAQIMQIAGYDAFNYKGLHGQSLELSTEYYSCFASNYGFYKIVSTTTSGKCPDFSQYEGKIVNGVERNIVRGAVHFPHNIIITSLDKLAKSYAASGPFSSDSISFGQWTD